MSGCRPSKLGTSRCRFPLFCYCKAVIGGSLVAPPILELERKFKSQNDGLVEGYTLAPRPMDISQAAGRQRPIFAPAVKVENFLSPNPRICLTAYLRQYYS